MMNPMLRQSNHSHHSSAAAAAASEEVSCPICCTDMTPSDMLYKLPCPTSTCQFDYCSDCLQSLQAASRDDYELASDGSLQVKVKLMCPQCRTPYKSKTYPTDIIVDAVLILRKAHSMQLILDFKDDDLGASALAERAEFCRSTSVEQVKTAHQRLETYCREIEKATSFAVPPLDWKSLQKHLTGTDKELGASRDKSPARHRNWKDPTLFLGLESLLTPDEQEFLTQLLTSGKPELLVQACFILHQMVHHPATASKAVQQLAQFQTFDTTKIQQLRKRYPLPRMPICIPLPENPSHFVSQLQISDQLVLKNTRGGIGKYGARNGDIITHMGDVAVSNLEEIQQALTCAMSNNMDNLTFTLNATVETAEALKLRAQHMQDENVRFY